MSSILVSQAAGVLTLTLNRPEKLNAFNPEMHQLLRQAIERAADNADIRARAAPIDLSVSIGSYYNPLLRRLREPPEPGGCAVHRLPPRPRPNTPPPPPLLLPPPPPPFR